MEIPMSFVPDVIVYVKKQTDLAKNECHFLPEYVWGDEKFWAYCGAYFLEKCKDMEEDYVLLAQKNTLKYIVVPFSFVLSLDKDVYI